jgi:hypothetical protein
MEVVCHMSKFRLILLSLFAVLAVSAVASASASALQYLTASGPVTTKLLTLSAQLTNAVLKSTGANVEVTCKKTLDTGFIEPGGLSLALILFEECAVGKPAVTCKVTEPIHVVAHDQLVLEEGKTLDSFIPDSGKTFTILHFTNCSLVTVEVEGMARASVENLTMQLKNTLKFTNNGPTGLLNAAGSNATFTLEEDVWLENDENWGVLD